MVCVWGVSYTGHSRGHTELALLNIPLDPPFVLLSCVPCSHAVVPSPCAWCRSLTCPWRSLTARWGLILLLTFLRQRRHPAGGCTWRQTAPVAHLAVLRPLHVQRGELRRAEASACMTATHMGTPGGVCQLKLMRHPVVSCLLLCPAGHQDEDDLPLQPRGGCGQDPERDRVHRHVQVGKAVQLFVDRGW